MTGAPERVSVVIPNYNKDRTLRACLEAVYAQTYPLAEVVVVDDASTDGSRDIIRDFPCRLVELPGNQGPSAARNAGAAAATSPLLFFVDSDTAPLPDAVANAVRELRANPDCGMVQGIYELEPLYDDSVVEAYKVAYEHFWHRQTVGQVTGTLFLCSLVRRDVFEETGGLDEALRYSEDVEFGSRMPERYRVLVSDAVRTRHDDDSKLWPMLVEMAIRSGAAPVVTLRTQRRQRAGASGVRLEMLSMSRFTYLDATAWLSFGLTALSLLLLPLALLTPWALVAALAAQAVFAVISHQFLRYVLRRKGLRFTLVATGIHILAHVAKTVGAAAGTLYALYFAVRRLPLPARVGGPSAGLAP
ncbi:glycosyltransferase [Actinomycetes bacterium KLBMP 9797]